jgi:hypothetical protein
LVYLVPVINVIPVTVAAVTFYVHPEQVSNQIFVVSHRALGYLRAVDVQRAPLPPFHQFVIRQSMTMLQKLRHNPHTFVHLRNLAHIHLLFLSNVSIPDLVYPVSLIGAQGHNRSSVYSSQKDKRFPPVRSFRSFIRVHNRKNLVVQHVIYS